MPAQDSPTPGPRPTYNARTGSTTSLKDRRANGHGPHSLTGTSLSTSHKVGPHRSHSRAHMIGHTRPQQTRVPSYGKNLGKLAKTHQAREGEGEGRATGRHHRRSRSHTPSSSPHTKQMHDALPLRNRSDASLVKHTTAALKKNSSKVSLKRNGSGKDLSKGPKAEKPARRPSSPSRARIKAHRFPSVHFDLGSNGQDDGWTEVSNSESPTVTRPASQASSRAAISGLSQITSHQADTDGKSAGVKNGAPLDPQAITSRLLQRHPRQNAPPQMSTISATGTPLHHSPRSLSHSQSSTLNGTPSTIRGSITTSNGIESPTRRRSSENDRSDDMSTATGRTRSAGVLTDADSLCQSIAGFNTMQASRTQQKLWLQRASSNIEHHQQMRPENGHSHGILGVGVGVGAGDGRDPRMQRQFDRTNNEYLVVRRHRDPLGDALSRLNRMPGTDRQRRIPATNATDGASDGSRLGLSQSMHEPRRVSGRREDLLQRATTGIQASGGKSKDDNGLLPYQPPHDHPHHRQRRSGDRERQNGRGFDDEEEGGEGKGEGEEGREGEGYDGYGSPNGHGHGHGHGHADAQNEQVSAVRAGRAGSGGGGDGGAGGRNGNGNGNGKGREREREWERERDRERERGDETQQMLRRLWDRAGSGSGAGGGDGGSSTGDSGVLPAQSTMHPSPQTRSGTGHGHGHGKGEERERERSKGEGK